MSEIVDRIRLQEISFFLTCIRHHRFHHMPQKAKETKKFEIIFLTLVVIVLDFAIGRQRGQNEFFNKKGPFFPFVTAIV